MSSGSPRGVLAGRDLQHRDDGFHTSKPRPPISKKRRAIIWLALVLAVVVALWVIDYFV